MVDVLVLAPTSPDLRGLRAALGDGLDGHVGALHVRAKPIGVGLPAAGVGAARRIERYQPRAVLLLGTCGIYPGQAGYQPHDVLVAQQVHLLSHDVDAHRAAFPDPMSVRLAANAAMCAGLTATRGRLVNVASPLAETRDDTLAGSVPATHGCQAEHLEAFSLAHACQLLQVPFGVVLAITHVVGSYGRDDFRRFHRQSSLAAAEVVVGWLHAGAPGLPHRA
ncbi:MAG TPA: hypothetical protein RMH85_25025 [Polyangiaceae bacterium LLY-WYZ-15_(1-7)]|nr:hypothetical protein [Sandaracinus sp.]HJK93115.1 hypothetical protein [Polyangiaceae bacterium LLY-WYZ-15_(1-7)]HJL06188.1 hypothetical protein [Polyangiaceae bacterium LLY-WYZ-15_(1-7)]HJL11763.1 hypothetical protein [Polyangiaceae bacterium LLY-WYZ-15_(1-7)]HJL21066.1 hypothetical protein [Polyangiaceae bacterium LLY-WYZ-15_(1-7)]